MRLRIGLGIGLAAFSIALFGAVGAADAFEWGIEHEPLGSLEPSSESVSLTGKSVQLSVPSVGLTISCSSTSGTGTIGTGGTSSGTVTLGGCSVVGAGAVCKVPNATASTTTEFSEAEVSGVERFFDLVSLSTSIKIEGEECSVATAGPVAVKGVAASEVPKPSEYLAKRLETFSKAAAERAGTVLKFGTNPAFLLGEITEQLSGAHEQAPAAVLPITFEPLNIVFAGIGGGNAKQITIKDVGKKNLKLVELGVLGPYGLADPNGCKGKELQAPPGVPNSCAVTVTCNEMKPGKLLVEYEDKAVPGIIAELRLRMRC